MRIEYVWNLNNTVDSRTEIDNTVQPGQTAVVSFTYDDRDRLIGETRVVSGSTTVYNIYYTYDQLGNRRTKTDTVAGLKTEYSYDVHDEYDPNYPTWNNRLTRYELRLLDDTLLRTVWYTYFVTGHVSNITVKDEWTGQGEAPPEYALYHDLALFYNMNDTLAYALWDHWLVNEQGEWYDYGMDHAREFRFDGPTQRYMVRDIADLGNGWEITDTLWTDYDGGAGVSPASPYNDFTVAPDGQGQPVVEEQTRYLEGFGIPAQQTVATGATKYLHGDLIRSTMLVADELGNSQPTLAYTAFGEAVTADGQGGWRVGYPPADPGTRYQYAGGWGYETGGFGDDPNLLSLQGANADLPPITVQHVGARWYDAAIGRFLQRDPISVGGGLNLYAYVLNDPLRTADPLGLRVWRVATASQFTLLYEKGQIVLPNGQVVTEYVYQLMILDVIYTDDGWKTNTLALGATAALLGLCTGGWGWAVAGVGIGVGGGVLNPQREIGREWRPSGPPIVTWTRLPGTISPFP